MSLRPRSRPETRLGGRACLSDQALGVPRVGVVSSSNGCSDSALTPKLPDMAEAGVRTSWGQCRLGKADRDLWKRQRRQQQEADSSL